MTLAQISLLVDAAAPPQRPGRAAPGTLAELAALGAMRTG